MGGMGHGMAGARWPRQAACVSLWDTGNALNRLHGQTFIDYGRESSTRTAGEYRYDPVNADLSSAICFRISAEKIASLRRL